MEKQEAKQAEVRPENEKPSASAKQPEKKPEASVPQKVAVEIFGETYRLKTDNNPQELKDVARLVDEKMKEIAQKTRTFSGNRIGVLAALEFADEYYQLKKDYDELMSLFDDE